MIRSILYQSYHQNRLIVIDSDQEDWLFNPITNKLVNVGPKSAHGVFANLKKQNMVLCSSKIFYGVKNSGMTNTIFYLPVEAFPLFYPNLDLKGVIMRRKVTTHVVKMSELKVKKDNQENKSG